jgi:predicted NBD/HSP70 family sugar kinase
VNRCAGKSAQREVAVKTAARGLAALLTAAVTACATSQVVIVGATRPAISPNQVQIFLQPPKSRYEQIANLSASSGGSMMISPADKMDRVIERLKKEAARLGANGILLYGVGDKAAGSVGAGISTETNNPQTASGLGFGASTLFFEAQGDGVAIFVEPRP